MEYKTDFFKNTLPTGKEAEKLILQEIKVGKAPYMGDNFEYAYLAEGLNAGFDIIVPNEFPLATYVEVKRDLKAQVTGNFAIEFKNKGNPSGIEITTANVWALVMDRGEDLYRVYWKVEDLKEKIKKCEKKMGGDYNNAEIYLVPVEELGDWKYLTRI